ncbi:hypothetical protein BC828DRAFT_161443 [Blastocladiella britannica]|nr:hypothetical protein BC828DRAFT_161443 [Blastocladiella britannica]
MHADYVKCLAFSPTMRCLVSGGLDRKVGLWDLGPEARGNIAWLSLPDSTPKQSVYTVACAPSGSLIATGSPDKLIRLWDPRTNRKVSQLAGHTDHVRSVVLADDGRSLLSASSDGSIKLWSLLSNRCVSTLHHHPDSVWALRTAAAMTNATSRAGLADGWSFYSGGRDGSVYRSSILSAGQSIDDEEPKSVVALLFRDDSDALTPCPSLDGACTTSQRRAAAAPGVLDLAVHEGIVYAATARSSLCGWQDISSDEWAKTCERVASLRDPLEDMEDANTDVATLDGGVGGGGLSEPNALAPIAPTSALSPIAEHAPVLMPSPSINSAAMAAEPFPTMPATTTSAAIAPTPFNAVPAAIAADAASSVGQLDPFALLDTPKRTEPVMIIAGQHGLIKHSILSNKRHVLTLDTANRVELWDIMRCVCVKSFGTANFDQVRAEINVNEYNFNWCSVDTKIGALSISINERCFDAEVYLDESGVDTVPLEPTDQRTSVGRWVLVSLFRHFTNHMRNPSVPSVEDDSSDDQPLVPPLPPVPLLSATELPDATAPLGDYNQPPPLTSDPGTFPENPATSSATGGGAVDDRGRPASRAGSSTTTPGASGAATPLAGASSASSITSGSESPIATRSRSRSLVSRLRRMSLKRLVGGEDASHDDDKKDGKSGKAAVTTPPSTPVITKPAVKPPPMPIVQGKLPTAGSLLALTNGATASTSGGGAAGTPAGAPGVAASASAAATTTTASTLAANGSGSAAALPSTATTAPLPPPPAVQAMPASLPPIAIPNETLLAVMEEEPDACSSIPRWSGTVGAAAAQTDLVSAALPPWLEQVLLEDANPVRESSKIGFQLAAAKDSGLPDLKSGNQRLQANRMVRVRRILAYIVDNSSIMVPVGMPVEAYLELVIAGQVANPMVTIGTLKTFVWRGPSDGDLTAVYRRVGSDVGGVPATAGASFVPSLSSASSASSSSAPLPAV